MNDDEIPNFNNEKEEIMYWKDTALQLREKVDELERELVEFQENSSQLEKELEKSLEHADRTNRDLKSKCNRLTLELDMYREKYEQQNYQSSKQISDLQKEISEFVEKEEKLLKYIRDLEQKNDDLERAERVMLESAGDMEAKLNSAIERNALLENELDEKEMLKTMLQRLKDEQRDMQQELTRQRRQMVPDNNKNIERVRTPVDVNKLTLETPAAPMKIGSNVGQLSPSNRISAINLVGDLLRKVGFCILPIQKYFTTSRKFLAFKIPVISEIAGVFGRDYAKVFEEFIDLKNNTQLEAVVKEKRKSIESKLAASRISKDISDSTTRESYKSRSQRVKRGITPSTFQNNIVKM